MPKHPVQPPDWIDAAPIVVSESVEIAAPASTVWAHIIDHESWPEWFDALDRVERIGTGVGVGSGRRVFAMRLPMDEEFTVWDENEQFAWAVVSSKLPILHTLAESVQLEPSAAGTRVTYRQGVRARAGFGWAIALAWKRPARQLADALERLRVRVESDVA